MSCEENFMGLQENFKGLCKSLLAACEEVARWFFCVYWFCAITRGAKGLK